MKRHAYRSLHDASADAEIGKGNLPTLQSPETAALTSPSMIEQWGGGKPSVPTKEGGLSAKLSAVLEIRFSKYVLARADKAAEHLAAERGLEIWRLATPQERVAGVREALADPSYRESLKDGFWNDFAYRSGLMGGTAQNNPMHSTEQLPPEILEQVSRDMDTRERHRPLDVEEESTDELVDEELERRGLDEDKGDEVNASKLAAAFDSAFDADDPVEQDHDQGQTKPTEASFAVGLEKEASEELPFDIFGDEDAYTQGERSLGALSVSRLQESRPRMEARPDALIREAATVFSKVVRSLKGFTVESKHLQKIVPAQVNQLDGRIITGKLIWNVKFADHTQRRRASVTLEMPIINGQPSELVLARTAGGQTIRFTQAAFDRLLGIRRKNRSSSNQHSPVPRSYIEE